MLTSSPGAAVKNSGRVMVYCGAHVAGAISGRPPTDRCDDPPAAAMGLWSPFSPLSSDGQVGTVFTFRANATDDIKLAKLEWDFEGDGKVDYTRPLSGRSIMATAAHAFGEQGVYYPQVRAVDSSGARSAWDRYAPMGLDAASANEAPLAASFAMSTEQDAALAFILEAKDLDGDSLTFSLVSLPEHGVLLGDAPDLSYVPDEGYLGHDSFTFAAGDGKGGESKPARVSITVVEKAEAEGKQTEATAIEASQPQQGAQEEDEEEGVLYNSQPMAQGQSVSTTEEMPAPVRLAATDADGDWLEFQIVSDPRYGMLSGTAPDLTYMPDAEFYGQDSFAFMASDSFGGSSTATVTVTVNPVNDMPAAYDDSASTAQDTPVSIYVLENDEDVEAEYLSIASASDPQNGSAAPGDGLVTYSPDPGFSGTDSFTYTVSDGQGGTASATVTVTIATSAPAPVPEPTPQPEPAQLYCGRQVSSFAHVIDGTEGKDSLTGTKEDDLIRGYGGNDVLKGKAGNDCIIGGQGDDKMYGDAGLDALEGGDGDDNMWGGVDDDKMWGGAGSDKVIGDGGVDLLYGDGGDDKMWGGVDDDTLFAGSGNDKLVGDGGNDVLNGQEGDDKIYDDLGDDTIDGGDGDDRCWDIIGSNKVTNCEGHS
ncbi:MAG: Ig-like domain-containing protein, partial [Nitrososphaera sp.]